ncbi:hypothetical protein [Algoriphagus vanfongensis]|uniref:hypothetical protein n=1 Tax=Algoriphagus vanfongensis TaxID=426371 RepID=UPI00047BC003|nr:hypothetical protein [Algoriphagus vanfongensis]
MNTPSMLDPAKNLATVFITILQVGAAIILSISIYMAYLAYLDLLTDWSLSMNHHFFHFSPEEGSRFWHMVFFSVPGLAAIVGFFVLAFLKNHIKKE